MKKLVAIFLLLIYGITTVGATVHMHYCMNKLVGSSLYQGKDANCGKCGMKKSATKGCCKDEDTFIQLKKEHNQISDAVCFLGYNCQVVLTPIFFYNQCINNLTTSAVYTFHSPPNKQEQKLYILHCIYRIWFDDLCIIVAWHCLCNKLFIQTSNQL